MTVIDERLVTAFADSQFEDAVVSNVSTGGDGWSITFADGWALWVRNELGYTRAPQKGDVLRKWGKGIGYTVRGIGLVLHGMPVGLYRYETEQEESERFSREQTAAKLKKRTEWEAKKDETAARIKALPEPFRQRIEFFMRRGDWGPEFGPYELFVCEEAVKLATFCGTGERVRELYKNRDLQKAAGISDEHSGNTFGAACRFARMAIEAPHLIPKEHGALCPLVGCAEYGCWSTTQKAAE